MNVKSIRANTPKAYTKLVKWIGAESKDILQFELAMLLKNERDLYDFFDECGIIIMIHLRYDDLFDATIAHGTPPHHRIIKLKNRIEAETAAFNKAWKILEKQ